MTASEFGPDRSRAVRFSIPALGVGLVVPGYDRVPCHACDDWPVGTGAARPASAEVSVMAALSIGDAWSIIRHTSIERSDPASAFTS